MLNPTYRPEIDGLRAIAVLSVVFYHAGLGFPGGFVGVDIFFVISGFLITSLIAKEMREGTFSFVRFWERRIRRIVPAFIVVAAFCLVAGWFFLLAENYLAFGKSLVAQTLLSSNLYFWQALNYFSPASETMPLLHTWSLAVEEQYYLLFPLGLFLLIRARSLGSDLRVLGILFLLLLASLASAAWLLPRDTEAAFYLLPTRAWELLAGAAVVFLPRRWLPRKLALREILSLTGLAALVVPLFLYSPETPFPGIAALPPCLGAALLIWANTPDSSSGTGGLTFLAKILGSPVPVFFGLISYSLYLWHWPLLAIPKAWTLLPLELPLRIGLVAAAVGLAALSWKLVEGPIRTKKVLAGRRSLFVAMAVVTIGLLSAGGAIVILKGVPQRFPAEVTKLYSGLEKAGPLERHSSESVDADKAGTLGKASDGAGIEVLLWGDSHARTAASGVDLFLKQHSLTGALVYYSATAPLFGYIPKDPDSLKQRAPDWAASVERFVQRRKVAHVLLGAFWKREVKALGAERLKGLLLETVARLNAAGAHVWVLSDVPTHKSEVPEFLAHSVLTGETTARFLQTPREYDDLNRVFTELAASNTNPKLSFLSLKEYLFDAASGAFLVQDPEGNPLYSDSHHLTGRTATRIYDRVLEDQMLPGISAPDPTP